MALIIHNYMLKKNYNNNRNYSYRIKEYFEKQNDSLCILAKDNNEAKYLFNELKLFIDNNLIQYFPDNELLPYDHFSIPESLVKKRFQIINSNIESKNIMSLYTLEFVFSTARPYPGTSTASHPNCEVKPQRARLVRSWGTRLEARVLSYFFLLPYNDDTGVVLFSLNFNLLPG